MQFNIKLTPENKYIYFDGELTKELIVDKNVQLNIYNTNGNKVPDNIRSINSSSFGRKFGVRGGFGIRGRFNPNSTGYINSNSIGRMTTNGTSIIKSNISNNIGGAGKFINNGGFGNRDTQGINGGKFGRKFDNKNVKGINSRNFNRRFSNYNNPGSFGPKGFVPSNFVISFKRIYYFISALITPPYGLYSLL